MGQLKPKVTKSPAAVSLARKKLAEQRDRVARIKEQAGKGNLAALALLWPETVKLKTMTSKLRGEEAQSARHEQLRREMVAAQGRATRAGSLARAVGRSAKSTRSRQAVLLENYMDFLVWKKGLGPKKHSFPPFNVTPAEAKMGLTPQIRQAQLEAALIAANKAGRLDSMHAKIVSTLRPIPVAQKDQTKVLEFVQQLTDNAKVPESRPTSDAQPASGEKVSAAEVDAALVDAETADAQIAETGEAANVDEVVADAAKPADQVVADVAKEATQGAAAGGGMSTTQMALIGAAVAAGVYFLVLKK